MILQQERSVRPNERYFKAPPRPAWSQEEQRRMVAALLVGASVFIYRCVFSHMPFLEIVANGILAGMVTSVAFRAKAVVIGIAVLAVIFLLVRAFGADPELPNDVPSGQGGQVALDPGAKSEEPAPGDGSVPVGSDEGAEGGEHDSLLDRFVGDRRSFLERLLSGSLKTVRDPDELKSVRAWVFHVREARKRLSERLAEVERLSSLRAAVSDPLVLFELGLLDRSSYPAPQPSPQLLADLQLMMSTYESTGKGASVQIFKDGTTDAMSRDYSGEPETPQGAVKAISPRCHGYTFVDSATLRSMSTPSLSCDAIRMAVIHYVEKTGDRDFMKAWKVAKSGDPNPSKVVRNVRKRLNLDGVEEDALGGEVSGEAVELLARYYDAYERDIEECEAFVAQQKIIAGFAAFTLGEAHKRVRAAEVAERQARIKKRSNEVRSPYAVSDETPVKSILDRRMELRAAVLEAVPKKKRGW